MTLPGRETLDNVRAWVLLVVGIAIVAVALLDSNPTILMVGVGFLGGAPVIAAQPKDDGDP